MRWHCLCARTPAAIAGPPRNKYCGSALAVVQKNGGLQSLNAALREHGGPLQQAHVQRAGAVHAPAVGAWLPAEGTLRTPVPAQH